MILALLLGFTPVHARADDISCGMTVTTDVQLESDLTCPGDGLIVGADGVTVDLNNHELSGSGVGCGICALERHFVAVRDGTIDGFDSGVRSIGGSSNTFSDLVVAHNTRGFFFSTYRRGEVADSIADSRISDNRNVGIQIEEVSTSGSHPT